MMFPGSRRAGAKRAALARRAATSQRSRRRAATTTSTARRSAPRPALRPPGPSAMSDWTDIHLTPAAYVRLPDSFAVTGDLKESYYQYIFLIPT